MFQPIAANKAIDFRVNVEAGVPPVAADSAQLARVFSNLIGNAVKFTPAGGEIEVGAVRSESTVVFWVRDTGCGIDSEHLPHLFQPYWRGDPQRSTGQGIGLAIAQQIITARGGRIWAESEPQRGSTFRLSLPAAT
jgi:signal transduction histidine kinase